MKPIWIYILATTLTLAGCDVGDRKARAEYYKANAEAAKQCETKLRGLKRVPIPGTDGKQFLNAERLPSWDVSRDFVAGDECGVATSEDTFFWTGKEIIPQSVWLAAGHSLTETQPHWLGLIVKSGFGLPRVCIIDPKRCDTKSTRPPYEYPAELTVRLKKYELDYWLPRGANSGQVKSDVGHDSMAFRMRGWPTEDGKARFISCIRIPNAAVRTIKEIEEIDFTNRPIFCQVESSDFLFKAGGARINFNSSALTPDTVTVLRAAHQYLNDSIIQE